MAIVLSRTARQVGGSSGFMTVPAAPAGTSPGDLLLMLCEVTGASSSGLTFVPPGWFYMSTPYGGAAVSSYKATFGYYPSYSYCGFVAYSKTATGSDFPVSVTMQYSPPSDPSFLTHMAVTCFRLPPPLGGTMAGWSHSAILASGDTVPPFSMTSPAWGHSMISAFAVDYRNSSSISVSTSVEDLHGSTLIMDESDCYIAQAAPSTGSPHMYVAERSVTPGEVCPRPQFSAVAGSGSPPNYRYVGIDMFLGVEAISPPRPRTSVGILVARA